MGIPIGNDLIYILHFADDQLILEKDYCIYDNEVLFTAYENSGLMVNKQITLYI